MGGRTVTNIPLRRVVYRKMVGAKHRPLIDFFRGQRLVGFVQKAARGVWFSCVLTLGSGEMKRHHTRKRAIARVEGAA